MARSTLKQPVPAAKRGFARAGFSIPAAAKELNMAEQTLRRAVDRGEIQSIRFGGVRRIPLGELERIRNVFHEGASS
jgi:excisionase family DNA binding protein